ncbi:TetR/AcrR family transcriptional regulator [Saccharothrix sp. SC076]|nr:TetR/AcrR family transcriptional regulator [Saccharothrix obliqua]
MREAVLAATEELLREVGAAQLSTRNVARRAAVAESSIFYHFGDRLGLLRAVVHTHLPAYKEVADRPAGQGSLRDNLVALLDGLESFYLRIAPILAAVQSDVELRTRFAELDGEVGPQRSLRPVAAYLLAERDLGRVRADLDVDAVALIITGVAHQRALLRHLSGRTSTASSAQVVDTLLPTVAPHRVP